MEKIRTQNEPSVPETLGWDVRPARDDYRELPIMDGFNWRKLLAEVAEYQGAERPNCYLVAFRSVKLPGAGLTDYLTELDHQSLEEAKDSLPGALLHYYADEVDPATNKALSWCLWTDQGSARAAIYSPIHTEAINAARAGDLYEEYTVERYAVTLDDDGTPVFTPLGDRQ